MHHPFQQWLTTLPDHTLIPTHSGLLTVVMWAAQAGIRSRSQLVQEAAHGVIAVEEEMWRRGLVPPPRPEADAPHPIHHRRQVKAEPVSPARLRYLAAHTEPVPA